MLILQCWLKKIALIAVGSFVVIVSIKFFRSVECSVQEDYEAPKLRKENMDDWTSTYISLMEGGGTKFMIIQIFMEQNISSVDLNIFDT